MTDVTAVWTHAGWLFLAAILDLFSRRVVGWATSATNDRFLALDALRTALVARRPPPGLLHHSDRGSPYASDDYRHELRRAGVVASMSRKDDCWDNAVSESFFATFKTEALGDHVPADDDAANRIIRDYIDGYYNIKRRHSCIDYECPIEFELKRQLAAKARIVNLSARRGEVQFDARSEEEETSGSSDAILARSERDSGAASRHAAPSARSARRADA